MKSRLAFISVIFLLLLCVLPLRAEVEWLDRNYNFGTFKEADGPRTGCVRFVNESEDPIFINRVRTSCGCTDASYTTDMIEPGDTATVCFTYNPKGRPGRFEKAVKVYIGKDNDFHVIRISGTVIGSLSTLQYSYPAEAGPLRLETIKGEAGEMKEGSSRHVFINLYNQSSDTIRPSWECKEKAIDIKLTPAAIPPGEIGTLAVYLRASEETRMGPVEYKFYLKADPSLPDVEKKELTVSAVIVPDTSKMTVEDIDGGARAFLVPEFIDFGEIGDDKKDFKFKILNDGQRTLTVARVYTSHKEIEITKQPSVIKPGKMEEVKGELNIRDLPQGPFRLKIEVITNDALHPLRTANLVGVRL